MIRDTAARNASLANDYGATKGLNSPAAHQLAIFYGDPAVDGVELTVAGATVRATVTNDGTSWPAPAGGVLTGTAVGINLTAEPDQASGTHFALFDAADGTTCWDTGELDSELIFTVAGIYNVTPVIRAEEV